MSGLTLEELEERLLGVGGSESPALYNEEPWWCGLELYYRKTRTKPDLPGEKRALLDLGSHLESFAVERYVIETGRTVQTKLPGGAIGTCTWRLDYVYDEDGAQIPVAVPTITAEPFAYARVVDPERPHIRATPDGLIAVRDDVAEPGMLEVKSLDPWHWRRVAQGGLRDGYVMQLHWTMGVAGVTWGAFCLLNRATGEIIKFDLERDDELVAKMQADATAFWQLVQDRTPPEPLPEIDDRCRKCLYRFRCRGDGLTVAEPGEKIEHTDTPLEVYDTPELQDAVSEYVIVKAEHEESKRQWDLARAGLIEALTERDADGNELRIREAVQADGARVYYKWRGRSQWDDKALLAQPTLLKVQKPGTPHDKVLALTDATLTQLGLKVESVLLTRFKRSNPHGGGRGLRVYVEGGN